MGQFVHLHLHTQYSLLDGVNKLPNVLEVAHKMGQPAIAMTDHGNMHGAVEFHSAAKSIGIKPIIGCELYVNPVSRHERKTKAQGGAKTHHLTVLAKNQVGYTNLCKLVSLAYKEGFYFKPRVDHEILAEFSEGLVVFSGCLSGELNSFVSIDDFKRTKAHLEKTAMTFKDNFYLEVQPHRIYEQTRLNTACVDMAKDLGIPLVATTDCHYLGKDDHFAQEVLMCISTGKQVTDPDRMRHEGVELHLKNRDEMEAEFGNHPWVDQALSNTLDIAEQCNVEFDFNTYYMPKFPEEPGKNLEQMMEKLARDGLKKRIDTMKDRDPDWEPAEEPIYEERLNEELTLINKMGFPGYFLVVADFINWAKEQDIPVGPGRGSVAGSLVAYAMRITEVDPIRNKLLFERFLNPERLSLPDIDVDFCILGRDKVIKYVVDKYGADKVAQIATFGTLKAKAAIKDVGRALGISYAETDRVAQLIPAPRQGFDYPLTEAIKMEKKLKDYANGEGSQLISLALKLEGLTRHTSTHAAGVVIGDRPLVEFLPMMVDKEGNDVTQYSMKYVEKIGLVKFDFLGLKTLTVINEALRLIRESCGDEVDLNNLPLKDSKTFEILCAGNTTGVFQLESSGITEMTMRLKPSSFDDLVAILALYRPGPLDAGMVDRYIERKHGREPVSYPHPMMSEILEDTYGIILYQEQIMQLAGKLAGYSLAEADLLRRAMGKKIPEEMAKQRSRFTSGAIEREIPEKTANEIFDQMETFARYGFNRSHSAAYAFVSFQTAYLKAHYKVEFMAALFSLEMGDSDKVLKNLNECRKQGINVIPPDVNTSVAGFAVYEAQIQYGMAAVKGVGENAVQAICEERDKNGPFTDLEDFATRVDLKAVNKRVVENLIKCGAFDGTGLSRAELMTRMDDVIRAGQSLQRDADSSQISLFGAESSVQSIPRRSTKKPEWPVNQKLAFERQALGFYISGHPLSKYKGALRQLGATLTEDIRSLGSRTEVKVGGVITALRLRNTKRGDRYASFFLEDFVGSVDSLVWPDIYQQYSQLLVADEPIIATGKTDVTDERCSFIIEKLESLIDMRDRHATYAVILLTDKDQIEGKVSPLVSVLQRHAGTCPVKAQLAVNGEVLSLTLKDKNEAPICVQPSEELCEEVEQIFGKPVLSFM